MRLLALAAAAALIAAAPPSGLLLREEAWTPAGDRAAMMTRGPRECLAETNASIELGRAAFRAPALLGGPAARAGLSCQACHANGRANAHFLLPELTDRAGHADVTSEWASAVRGDGVFNPLPIPDLASVSQKRAFGRNGEALGVFVRGVIVEEFQGAQPPAAAFDGLLAYLNALRPCPEEDDYTLAAAAGDTRRAFFAARAFAGEDRRLGLAATQEAVARIVERLPAAAFARERRSLELLARELGAAREDAAALSPGWLARFDGVIARIAPKEPATYFHARTLRRDLAN